MKERPPGPALVADLGPALHLLKLWQNDNDLGFHQPVILGLRVDLLMSQLGKARIEVV